MAKKEFLFHGRKFDEIKGMSLNEFSMLLPARQRRTIKHGFTDLQKSLLKNLKKKNDVETHCRDMIIIPEMVGKTIKVHNGKTFEQLAVTEEMLGHYLGEFVLTRKRVTHNAPGVGATRSSASQSVR
jgi:small subunit ribosomal protein S19